jgi:RimJ/RimL family protein N-acetyltransferase
MIELQQNQFLTAAPLFQSTHYGVLAAATLEGKHPGRVFCDDPTNPTAAVVCTRVGYYFLAGSAGNADFNSRMAEAFASDLAPRQKAETGDPQILLFYPGETWREPLFTLFKQRSPIAIRKKRMILPPGAASTLSGWQQRVPNGLRVEPVTIEMLEKHPEKAVETRLFWGTLQAFTHNSLGFWVMDGDSILSSVEAVFTGGGEAEISIATTLQSRRRGLAVLAASAFIEASLGRGLNPIWGCWPENHPSIALAQRLGFIDDVDQEICFWEYK